MTEVEVVGHKHGMCNNFLITSLLSRMGEFIQNRDTASLMMNIIGYSLTPFMAWIAMTSCTVHTYIGCN